MMPHIYTSYKYKVNKKFKTVTTRVLGHNINLSADVPMMIESNSIQQHFQLKKSATYVEKKINIGLTDTKLVGLQKIEFDTGHDNRW